MTKLSFTIGVEIEKEPTVADIYTILMDFKARLEGYYTETPEQLIGSNMNFSEKYFVNGEEKNLFEEIKKVRENTLPSSNG